MKKSEIIKCVKANRQISAYELKFHHKDSRELFYVLDHLEINRAVKTETVTVRVYVSDGKTTGSSLVSITAADDEKSLARKLKNAVKQAKAAPNPYFPLTAKSENLKEKEHKKYDLNEIASKVAEAVLKADTYEEGWINSTEIFVSRYQDEFLNSNGVDHQSDSFRIEVECIPTWSNKKEEFELYKFYESDTIDYKKITQEIDEILQLAKARSEARTLKDVKIPDDVLVLVKNDMLDLIVRSLAGDLSYRNVYLKQNHYEKGDQLSDNPFDLTLNAAVKGCSSSEKYDGHGVVLSKRRLLSKGKVKDFFGDIQFGYYLGEKKISGDLPVCTINAQGIDFSKKKHLIIETFSSPQMEENSGYWGGEVRLARYFDGKKYIPLTGFSIAGMLYDDIRKVAFSKETTVHPAYKGPRYMIFKGLKIS